MTDVKGSILGNAVLRREDPTLLTGEDKYFADMEIAGLGFVYFAGTSFNSASSSQANP